MRIPSEKETNIRILKVWREYRDLQKQYLEARNQYLTELYPTGKGPGIDYIWNGDGFNDNALLTIFRHFDSATVVKGFVGQMPQTGWVMDYPLLERIHYLLVAGFDVFGNLGHQAETRLYMDYLRMEGESNFLAFLPKDSRQEIWNNWYSSGRDEGRNFLAEQFYGLERGTGIQFRTNDPKNEFFQQLLTHVGPAAVQHDRLNRCGDDSCFDPNAGPMERLADRQMRRLTKLRGRQLEPFADVAFVHILMGGEEQDLVYTLIRNKALSNNSRMFREEHRRKTDDDTLTVVKGYMGSYPNEFVRIAIDQLEVAVDEYTNVKDAVGYFMLAQKYSFQRNSPAFWEESDWHYRRFLEQEPIEGGLFDMYRYYRIGEKADEKVMVW